MSLFIFLLTFAIFLYLFPETSKFLDRIYSVFLCLLLPTDYAFTILENLELGVAIFCYRLSLKASKDWLNAHLDEKFKEQAYTELAHAKFFNRFSGRPKLNLSFETFNPEHGTIGGVQIDSISTAYLSTKILFGFRSANTYQWREILAFMVVLEELQSCFYQALLVHPHFHSVKKELNFIIQNEEQHSIELLASLWSVVGPIKMDFLIWKWQVRKYLALLFVPVDVIWYLVKLSFF